MPDSILDALVSARFHLAELEKEIDCLTALCTATEGEDVEFVPESDALFAIAKSIWPKYPESTWASAKVKVLGKEVKDMDLTRDDRKKLYKALNKKRENIQLKQLEIPEITP